VTSRRLVWAIWILLAVSAAAVLIVFPDLRTPEKLATAIRKNPDTTLLVYVLLVLARCATLFPLTPFIIAGALIWPHDPVIPIVFCWMSGQLASVIHYHFPSWMGIDDWARRKYPRKLTLLERRMQKSGFWYVLLVSMVPVMPGELVYFVSGTVRVPFWAFQLAIGISHAVVISVYVLVVQGLA
jgi:uncharacterized membrane protein YdjX (TVP38/TMEM64 family)